MIVAAVPIKQLAGAKSRLAPHISDRERVRLIVDLLERVVTALRDSDRVARIALVTPERDLCRRLDVDCLPDRGGLNRSLQGAVVWAREHGADGLLILPGDLPCVTGADIQAFLERSGADLSVGVAPTRDGGTGALLLQPIDVMPPQFGPASAERHLLTACARDLEARAIEIEGLSVDLDTMDDYRQFVPLRPTTAE